MSKLIQELIQLQETKLLENAGELYNSAARILKDKEKELSSKTNSSSSHNIGGNFNAVISGNVGLRKNFVQHMYGGFTRRWDLMLEIGNNIEGGSTEALKQARNIFTKIAHIADSEGATVKSSDAFMTIEKDGEMISVIYEYARSFCWVGIKAEKSQSNESKTHRVKANTFTPHKPFEPSKGRDRDDPNWDWKNPNDNPSGEKPHKYSGNPADYPIIDDEFNRHLFDEDLVSHLKSEYGAKVWNKMSELEQIEAQLDFVSDPRAPSFGSDVRKYNKWLNDRAKKLQSQIKRK